MTLKSLECIFDEVRSVVEPGFFPIIIWDTSAVIDICTSARNERNGKRKISDPDFLRTHYSDHFFMSFGGEFQSIISGDIYREIEEHYGCRVNAHVLEIDQGVRPLLDKFHKDYWRLKTDYDEDLSINKDVKDAAKNCSFRNEKRKKKKEKENFSREDLSLLKDAIYFSEYFYLPEHEIKPVIVLSSDAHVLEGIKELKNKGYKNIRAISLRRNKNGE